MKEIYKVLWRLHKLSSLKYLLYENINSRESGTSLMNSLVLVTLNLVIRVFFFANQHCALCQFHECVIYFTPFCDIWHDNEASKIIISKNIILLKPWIYIYKKNIINNKLMVYHPIYLVYQVYGKTGFLKVIIGILDPEQCLWINQLYIKTYIFIGVVRQNRNTVLLEYQLNVTEY